MKELIAGIVLLLVIGIGAFIYRNQIELPGGMHPAPGTSVGTSTIACTQEAKVCPDGSAVGRSGPNCTFAACPVPNVELAVASSTIGFVLPAGYTQLEQGASGQSTIRIYQKPTGTADQNHVLTISDSPIPQGGSASAVMLANTVFDPSGIQATSTSSFMHVTIGKNTFWAVQVGRFEGQVETAYYLPRMNDVLKFDLTERGVTDWTDPNLNVAALPEHQTLVRMLATLQAGS